VTNEEHKAREMVAVICDKADHFEEIAPAWVATMLLLKIDPDHHLTPMGYALCHMQARQIARECLRGRWEPESDGDDGAQLEFEELQGRYPRARRSGAEPRYAKRDSLTDADVRFNTQRLRAIGVAVFKHADALELWHANRKLAVA
jgi:hypothetical protein